MLQRILDPFSLQSIRTDQSSAPSCHSNSSSGNHIHLCACANPTAITSSALLCASFGDLHGGAASISSGTGLDGQFYPLIHCTTFGDVSHACASVPLSPGQSVFDAQVNDSGW